jgi:hypothetical protein
MGTCPKCDKPVKFAQVESVVLVSGIDTWNGISYVCQSCHCVLGIGFDPSALREDIVSAVVERLGQD